MPWIVSRTSASLTAMPRACGASQDALVDQRIQDLALVVDASNARGSNARPAAGAVLARLLERARKLRRDLVALPQHRHGQNDGAAATMSAAPRSWRQVFVALEQVLLHAEEGERHDQQAEDDGGDPAGGLVAGVSAASRSACSWT
jgi:hypothetical protein